MAGTRRTGRTAGRQASQPRQPGIRAFGKVSKAAPNEDVVGKIPEANASRLKKRMHTPDPEDDMQDQSPSKRRCLQAPTPRTPKKSEKIVQYLPTPENTPEKDYRAQLNPAGSISATATLFSIEPSTSLLPQSLPNSEELPEAAQDFIRLYISLLRALSLHYAHNGVSSPADIHKIASSASKIWGKRAVKIEDIRRCFGVQDSGFDIVDYGRGKTCIERKEHNTRSVVPQALNEEKLGISFAMRMQDLWTGQLEVGQDTDDGEIEPPESFINSLPQAKITVTPTLEKIAPIFSLGKKRLEEFRRAQAQSCNVEEPTTPTHPRTSLTQSLQSSHSTSSTTSSQLSTATPRRAASSKAKSTGLSLANRQSTLLARLSEKSARTAADKASKRELTKADHERRAALHRLPDVAAMLPLPRAGKSRSTYTLREMIQQVRDSSRTPLGNDEVETCLRVLGEEEVGDGWIKIVDTLSGAKDAVAGIVVDHGRRVNVTILKSRVRLELERI